MPKTKLSPTTTVSSAPTTTSAPVTGGGPTPSGEVDGGPTPDGELATSKGAPSSPTKELEELQKENLALHEKLKVIELEKQANKDSKIAMTELQKSMREFRSTTPNSRYITKSNQEVTFRSAARKVGTNEDGTSAEVVYGVFITNVPGLIRELQDLARTNPQITAH